MAGVALLGEKVGHRPAFRALFALRGLGVLFPANPALGKGWLVHGLALLASPIP